MLDLPTKTTLFATLVALVNKDHASFGEKIVQQVSTLFIKAVNTVDIMRVKILLRFLNELAYSSVIAVQDVMLIHETIVEQACKNLNIAQATNTDSDTAELCGQGLTSLESQNVQDSLMYAVVASLPWGIPKMIDVLETRLDKLLERIDAYVKRYYGELEKQNTLCVLFPKNEKQQHILPVTWSQFYTDHRYREGSRALLRTSDYFEDLSKVEKKHAIAISAEQLFPSPTVPTINLRIFRSSLGVYQNIVSDHWKRIDVGKPRVRRTLHTYDQMIIEEYISDMLYFFNSSYKVLVNHLYDIPLTLTTQALLTEEDLKNEESDDSELREEGDVMFDHILVDSILANMLTTPTTPFNLHYYVVTLIEICRHQIREKEKNLTVYRRTDIIEDFVNALFDRLEEIDLECALNRLPIFISHFLANFEYKWNWGSWMNAIDTDRKRSFVKQVLERTMRLSSLEQVKNSLQIAVKPESDKDTVNVLVAFENYLPKHATPVNKLEKDAIVEILATRSEESAKKLETLIVEELKTKERKIVLESILIGILQHSGKSYHALQGYMNTFGNCLQIVLSEDAEMEGDVNPNVALESSIVRTILDYWQNSSQHAVITIEKLLHYRQFLHPQSLIVYLFNQKVSIQTFEIVRVTIEYLIVRNVRALRNGDEKESTTSLHELSETLFLLLKHYIRVLLNSSDDESFEYQMILDHFKEAVRKWQRYVPFFSRFVAKLIESYSKTLLSSPQLVQITQIYTESRYYQSMNTHALRGLNVLGLKENKEDGLDEEIVSQLYKREQENDIADKILRSETIYK